MGDEQFLTFLEDGCMMIWQILSQNHQVIGNTHRNPGFIGNLDMFLDILYGKDGIFLDTDRS